MGALQQRFQVRSTKHNGQDGWILVPVSYAQTVSNQALPANITAVQSSSPKVSSGTLSASKAAQPLFHSLISAPTGSHPPPQGMPIILQSTNAQGTMLMPVSNAAITKNAVISMPGSIASQVTPQQFIPTVGRPATDRSATNLASVPTIPLPMTIIQNPGQILTNIQSQQMRQVFQVLNPSGQSDAPQFPLQQAVPSAIITMNTLKEAGSTKTPNSVVNTEPQPICIFQNIADSSKSFSRPLNNQCKISEAMLSSHTMAISRPIASQCLGKKNPTTMTTAQIAKQNVLNGTSVRTCNPTPYTIHLEDSNNCIEKAKNIHRIDLSNILNRLKSSNNASLTHTATSKSTMHSPAILRSPGKKVQKKMLNFLTQKLSKEVQSEDSKVTKDLLAAKKACGATELPSFSNQNQGIMNTLTAAEKNQKTAVTIPNMSEAHLVVVKSEPIDPEMPVLEKVVPLQAKEIGLKINSVFSLSDNSQKNQLMIDGPIPATSKEMAGHSSERSNEKENNSKINADTAPSPSQSNRNDTTLLSSAPVKFRINALRQKWLSNSLSQNRAETNISDSVETIERESEMPTNIRDNPCHNSISTKDHDLLKTPSETPNVQIGETSHANDDLMNQHRASFYNIRSSLKRKLSQQGHDMVQRKRKEVPQKVQMSPIKSKKVPDLDYERPAKIMSKLDCYVVMETLSLNGTLQVKTSPDAGIPCPKHCRERHLRNMSDSMSVSRLSPTIHPWMMPNAPRRRNGKVRWTCGNITMAYSNFKPIKMKPNPNTDKTITSESASTESVQSPVMKALLQRVSQNIKDGVAKSNASRKSQERRKSYIARIKIKTSEPPRYESDAITRYRAIQKKMIEPRRPMILPANNGIDEQTIEPVLNSNVLLPKPDGPGEARFIAPPQLFEELKVEDLPPEGAIYDACDKVFVANLGRQILLIPSYHDSICKKAYKVDPKVYEHLKKNNRLPNVKNNLMESNQSTTTDKVATNIASQMVDNSQSSKQSSENSQTHVSVPADVIQNFREMRGVKISQTIKGTSDSASMVREYESQSHSETKGPLAYDTVTLDPVTGILNQQIVPSNEEQKELFDSIRTLRLLLKEKVAALFQVRGIDL